MLKSGARGVWEGRNACLFGGDVESRKVVRYGGHLDRYLRFVPFDVWVRLARLDYGSERC
jgi:hypothetical protein